MVEVRVPVGHEFWAAGERATESLHIIHGRVRCSTPDGAFVDVGSDFTLGVLDVWGPQVRAYTARAETEVIAYRIAFENFLTILESHRQLALDLAGGFGRSLLDSDESM